MPLSPLCDARRAILWSRIFTALVIGGGATFCALLIAVSIVTAAAAPDGLSQVSNKPLPWDFTNLWLGGRLALDGRIAVLFDVAAYRDELRAMFAPAMDDSEWSYPPLALLVGAPLAVLPLNAAFIVWTLLGLACLVATCRMLRLPWRAPALLLLSPAVLMNALFGQNGALTASLLLAGLWLSARRPRGAGLCFGLLAFKPQLGLLLPVPLIAARRWTALVWAILFTGALVTATLLIFGIESWHGFLTVTRPLMQAILEAPFGQGYHAHSITPFAFLRALGAGLPFAYAVQALLSGTALALTVILWRRPTPDPVLRCVTMGPLALLATPYSFSYDMVVVAVAVLVLLARNGFRLTPLLAVVWIWPAVNHLFAGHRLPLAPLVLALAAALCLAELRRVAASRARPEDLSATAAELGVERADQARLEVPRPAPVPLPAAGPEEAEHGEDRQGQGCGHHRGAPHAARSRQSEHEDLNDP